MIDLPFYRDFGFPSAEYIDDGFWVLHEREARAMAYV